MQKVLDEIEALEGSYLLKTSTTELEDYYSSEVLINPLVLHVDEKFIESEGRIKVKSIDYGELITREANQITIAIPFEGDGALWDVRPSTFSLSGYPEIEVQAGLVSFSCIVDDRNISNSEGLRAAIEVQISALQDAVRNLRADIDLHNLSAPALIKKKVAEKKALAEATSNAIASLGIPIKRRGESLTYAIPAKRKPSPLSKPVASKDSRIPEPEIAAAEFEFILRVIKSMALVMERDPASYAEMDEPAIRTQFLLQLNGHYEGGATGETFNAGGKTDILIRVQDRNVFIAECKFWKGPKSFDDAVEQLLGYLSWRDSKCALLIFNRNKDSSAVKAAMHTVMEKRPEFRRTTAKPEEGDGRYVLVKRSDPGREIHVCTMLFDVPLPLNA